MFHLVSPPAMLRLPAILSAALLAAGTTTTAAAQSPASEPPAGPPPGGLGTRGSGRGWPSPLLDGITLTPAQQAAVDSIQTARRAAMRAQMQQSGGAPDQTTRAAMRQAMDQDRAAVRALLTADQQTTFDANVARLQERMRQRGAGGGPGQGRGGRD